MLISPLLCLSLCNCTGFFSLPPAALFPFHCLSQAESKPINIPSSHKQASPHHASTLQGLPDELDSLCSPEIMGEGSPCFSLMRTTRRAWWTRGENTPILRTSLPRGEDTPHDNRESRGAAHVVPQGAVCVPASRFQGWAGVLVPNFLSAACRSGHSVPDCGLLVFLISHWEAGRLSAQPSPDTVPGSVSALRTYSRGNPRCGYSSTVVLQSRISFSSSGNICMFLLLSQKLVFPVVALVLQMARVPFLVPHE